MRRRTDPRPATRTAAAGRGSSLRGAAPASFTPLPAAFYARNALRVARDLLGKLLVRELPEGRVVVRIVEVEAYRGPADRAAHSFGGRRTPRNEVMYGPAGRLYVYFVYGMHWCANVVAAREGVPEAVLLRGAEVIEGSAILRARRGRELPDHELLRGPANLCKALGVDGTHNGVGLETGAIHLADAPRIGSARVRSSPRIGVDYAGVDASLPWRLFVADCRSVSGPRQKKA